MIVKSSRTFGALQLPLQHCHLSLCPRVTVRVAAAGVRCALPVVPLVARPQPSPGQQPAQCQLDTNVRIQKAAARPGLCTMYCTVLCTVQRVPARQPASLGRVRVGLVWAAGPPLLQRIRGLASHNSHTYLASAAVIPAYLLSSSHTYISIIQQSYLNIYYLAVIPTYLLSSSHTYIFTIQQSYLHIYQSYLQSYLNIYYISSFFNTFTNRLLERGSRKIITA